MLKERVIHELRQLGTVKDESERVPLECKHLIPYRYCLSELKYDALIDDNIIIYVYSTGNITITNDQVTHQIISDEDTELFKSSFENNGLEVNIMYETGEMSVMGHASNMNELKQLLLSYRRANDCYLKDKVVERLDNNNKQVLFRKNDYIIHWISIEDEFTEVKKEALPELISACKEFEVTVGKKYLIDEIEKYGSLAGNYYSVLLADIDLLGLIECQIAYSEVERKINYVLYKYCDSFYINDYDSLKKCVSFFYGSPFSLKINKIPNINFTRYCIEIEKCQCVDLSNMLSYMSLLKNILINIDKYVSYD